MDWTKLRLYAHQTIQEALACIDKVAEHFALVTDEQNHLLGVVTDGNIRRGLLRGLTLTDPIETVMNPAPATVQSSCSALAALQFMEEKDFSHLPVIDANNKLLHLWSKKKLAGSFPLENTVILMAGGLGTRLGELTKNCPKPMLCVGDKPILEIVLRHFMSFGFKKFYFAVNYKADIIKAYFGNGKKFGCAIEYLHEEKRLGTAGALSLLPTQQHDFLVANADILTQLNMRCLLAEHEKAQSMATMVAKRYSMQVPYGVVDKDENNDMIGIREKPELDFCVSAGMYALSPECLPLIPQDTFFDMPELFQKIMQMGKKPHILETEDYWLDIGRQNDFERAQMEYGHD